MADQRLTERTPDRIYVLPAARTRTWPGLSLMALRAIASLHLLALFAQPVTAGRYLAGDGAAVLGHQLGARILVLLCAAQVVTAAILWWKGGVPSSLILGSAFLLVAELVEVRAGRAMAFQWHIPLGVLLFGGAMRVLRGMWNLPLPSVAEARPAV